MANASYEDPQMERLPNGTVLRGRYEVRGEIGEGGFAIVYKGWDKELGREIAIKVLNVTKFGHDREAYDNVVERFRREAQTSSKLDHPNAVAVYDFGDTETGSPFIIMEFLDGYDLDVEIGRFGVLTVERAVRLFAPCLDALGKAHDLGVVHKDLKPGNLFMCEPRTDRERLVILDFGVARINAGDDASKLTTDGQVLGTPQYMAPEYIERQLATPALDVYQMGLILVESLTGTPVVADENMVACLIAHTTGNIGVPSEVTSGPLGGVISKALEMEHTKRYENGHVFAQALRDLGLVDIAGPLSDTPQNPDYIPNDAKTVVTRSPPPGEPEPVVSKPPVARPAASSASSEESSGTLKKIGIAIAVLFGMAVVLGIGGLLVYLAFFNN